MHSLLFVPFLAAVLGADPVDKSPVESYPIRFEPGPAEGALAPRFSPHGTQVTLTARAMPGLTGIDHLEGRLKLGPRKDKGPGQLYAGYRSVQEMAACFRKVKR